MCPTNAWHPASRQTAHGSGSVWFATLYRTTPSFATPRWFIPALPHVLCNAHHGCGVRRCPQRTLSADSGGIQVPDSSSLACLAVGKMDAGGITGLLTPRLRKHGHELYSPYLRVISRRDDRRDPLQSAGS